MQKVTKSNSHKTTHTKRVNQIHNDQQVSLKLDPETMTALTQIEERRDYYQTCINGGY
ncbi:hypothetical protein QUB70_17925 [Microcoleus sp. A003_D6]|uniref:hypothetical protein n=1 Tax=Microcoleus sp. A003_D6 TaxID=3055266 RepID=UPI002FD4F878